MIRYFCCRVGNWMIRDWHLYRLTKHVDAGTGGQKASWVMWDKII